MAPPDPATLNPSTMGYRELQQACKAIGLPAKGKTQTLRQAIQNYVNDPHGVIEQLCLFKEKRTRGSDMQKRNGLTGKIMQLERS